MTRTLAMFPLGSVLFPLAQLSLHVFEPRYRVMMHDVLASERELGVVLIERGHEVGGGDKRFDVGTLASLVSASELPDGRWAVVVVGVRRLRVERWLADDPYPRAEVSELDDVLVEPGRAQAQRAAVAARFAQLVSLAAELDPRLAGVPTALADDPAVASYETAARAPLGPLDAQRLLEVDDVVRRLDLLEEMLDDQIALVRARLGRPDG